MAKKKAKTSSQSKETNSSGSANLPLFNEESLSVLTARIEAGLGTSKTPLESPVPASGSSKQKKLGRTESSAQDVRQVSNANQRRGTKRDAKGNAKHEASQSTRKRDSTQHDEPAGNKASLLQEILALGGTEDDLDLVADVSSEEEGLQNDNTSLDKSFKKELASFVSGLGIEGTAGNQEDAASQNEDTEDDWVEESDADISRVGESSVVPCKENNNRPEQSLPVVEGPKRLIFEARPDWHKAHLTALPEASAGTGEYRHAILALKEYATSLLELDSKLYASKHLSSSSSHRFLSTIMASGTLSDKVSALTLVVQESPVHTTKSFESLLMLAKKRSRGQAVTALGALKDLLGAGVVLPSERRLHTFASQPGLLGSLQKLSVATWTADQRLPGQITKAHLISWAYEDWLKEQYFEMLKILEGWCNDEVEYARSRAVSYVYELLKEKPEQEANLLRLLVNKLGDPEKKIASRASYLLLQLQMSHPLMKPIIIRSIESELLLRPGQSHHARYYAINTLNQTILSGKEEEVSMKLLDIYFGLFVSLLKKPEEIKAADAPTVNRKGQIQGGGAPMGKKAKAKATKEEEAKSTGEETTEKLISAVLTGVNRAFPFAKTDDLTLENHMNTLFRITHSSNFNTSIQALMLIEQLATSKHLSVDRFYRTLYESLLDPRLVTSSKHALYLNLLFRALKADLNVRRVQAFVKRMLQVVTLHQPPFICGIIYLLRELESIFPALKSLLTQPEEGEEDDEEVFRDVPENGSMEVIIEKAMPGMSKHKTYDGRKRDPEHSNADKSCIWELIPFLDHFHPSVSMFASRLASDEKFPSKPDLASHTLASFLDRFVYRNAKAAASSTKGGSIMQPLAGGDSRGVLLSNRVAHHVQEPLNTESFWRKKAEDVAVDEVFFHKYFSQIGKSKQSAAKKTAATKKDGDTDDEDGENKDEIWQALVDSRPEVEGPSDEDSDLGMLDLDDSDASDDEDAELGEASLEEPYLEDDEDSDDAGEIFADGSEEESDVDALFEQELQAGKSEETEVDSRKSSKEKRKKLKGLPTFASAEDYAEMMANNEGEDVP